MNFGTHEKNLRKAPTDIQPVHTRIIDLEAKEDELLDNMKPKTRYNIRLACRKGIVVNNAPFDRLSEWYRMYKDTVRRNRITVHSYTQFKKLLTTKKEHSLPNTDVHLLMAQKGPRPLAGMILVIHADTATYLYGASSSGMRNLMPTYSLLNGMLYVWRTDIIAPATICSAYRRMTTPPIRCMGSIVLRSASEAIRSGDRDAGTSPLTIGFTENSPVSNRPDPDIMYNP